MALRLSAPAAFAETEWLRPPGDTSSFSGFMTQLTVTGLFVNKSLFEQAEIATPGDGATWDEWAAASNAVAERLDIPIPMAWDRSGHRVAGSVIDVTLDQTEVVAKNNGIGLSSSADISDTIDLSERLGGETYLHCSSGDLPQMTVHIQGQLQAKRSEVLNLKFDRQFLHLFDANGDVISNGVSA